MKKYLFFFIVLFSVFDTFSHARSTYYYDDSSLKEYAKKGKSVVFFSTGWSGSALGKMNKPVNTIKQSRGFSIAYSLALRMYHSDIKGKVIYLTFRTTPVWQRKYLFDLHETEHPPQQDQNAMLIPINPQETQKSQVRQLTSEDRFKKFEEEYFEQVLFTADNLIENLPPQDSRRYDYLFRGPNATPFGKLQAEVEKLKANGAFFAGIEYHFGGPFFQKFKIGLGLSSMPLLGSEIYDQLGDDDIELPVAAANEKDSNWENLNLGFPQIERIQAENPIPKDLGTKGHGRRLYRDAGVDHPRGLYEPEHDVKKLAEKVYDFLEANRDIKSLVIKLERSSAGDGNKTIHFAELIRKHKSFWRKRERSCGFVLDIFSKQFSEMYQRRIRDHGAVFEEYIQGENFTSPAVLGMIMPDSVEVYFDYVQKLKGQTYIGSIGPVSNQNMSDFKQDRNAISEVDLREPSIKILEALRKQGARGPVGIDFVTYDQTTAGKKERRYKAIENNVRQTGTMYPHRVVFYLAGKEAMENKYFASTDSVPVSIPEDLDKLKEVRRWFYQTYLPNSEQAYKANTKTGCVIYFDIWIAGKVGIACLADTKKELEENFDKFKTSISRSTANYVNSLKK